MNDIPEDDDFLSGSADTTFSSSELFRKLVDSPQTYLQGPLCEADLGKGWNVHGDCRFPAWAQSSHPGLTCEEERDRQRQEVSADDLPLRRAVAAYLNGLVQITPDLEPQLRKRLSRDWNFDTIVSHDSINPPAKHFASALNRFVVKQEHAGTLFSRAAGESKQRERLATETLGYLGIDLGWLGYWPKPSKGEVATYDRETLHLALRVLIGLGFEIEFISGALEAPTEAEGPAKPGGEKGKALEALRKLALAGSVTYSDWITQVAATQPNDKSESARKKLARTYAARLIDDGRVLRTEDGKVSPA